eukprot:15473884-Alexandrium_andersonii.AAC.1
MSAPMRYTSSPGCFLRVGSPGVTAGVPPFMFSCSRRSLISDSFGAVSKTHSRRHFAPIKNLATLPSTS